MKPWTWLMMATGPIFDRVNILEHRHWYDVYVWLCCRQYGEELKEEYARMNGR